MVRIFERKKTIDPRLMNTAPQTVRLAERERLRSIADGQDVYLLLLLEKNDEDVVIWKGECCLLGNVNCPRADGPMLACFLQKLLNLYLASCSSLNTRAPQVPMN